MGLRRVLLQQESLAEAAAAFTAATAGSSGQRHHWPVEHSVALKQFPEALTLAYEALSKPQPNETSMYDKVPGWRGRHFVHVSFRVLGNCEALRDAVLRYGDLLRQGRVPQREIARIEQNIVCIKARWLTEHSPLERGFKDLCNHLFQQSAIGSEVVTAFAPS